MLLITGGNMAKSFYCTSCGAQVSENEEKCPYCGAINPVGAEAAYMNKLHKLNKTMSQMDDDLEETYVRELKRSGVRLARTAGIVILIFLILAAALLALEFLY